MPFARAGWMASCLVLAAAVAAAQVPKAGDVLRVSSLTPVPLKVGPSAKGATVALLHLGDELSVMGTADDGGTWYHVTILQSGVRRSIGISGYVYGGAVLVASDGTGVGGTDPPAKSSGSEAGPSFAGELDRVTIGYEQVGASGTPGDQKYSFDFFSSSPLPVGHSTSPFGTRLRWWGDVGVASYPQQVNSDVLSFGQGFATSVAAVPVNQLAYAAEFRAGLEVRLAGSRSAQRFQPGDAEQYFALTAFADYGGLGALNPPPSPTVFQVPAAGPQLQALNKSLVDRGLQPIGADDQYIAVVPATNSRYMRETEVGLRMYTFYADSKQQPLAESPSTVEIAIGRNGLVDDSCHRWVCALRASGVFALPLGTRADGTTILYLFGDVVLALGAKSVVQYPVQLEPALDSTGAAVKLSDPGVLAVPADANPRDTYRIGVALDLVGLWQKVTAPASKN